MQRIITAGVLALLGLANSASAYQHLNGQIVDENKNNEKVLIDGVNWSGFQDTKFVDQLTGAIPLYPIAKEHQDPVPLGVIDMLKNPEKFPDKTGVNSSNAVSFKTIRIPINPTNLNDSGSLSKINMGLVDPREGKHNTGNGVFCKEWNVNGCTQWLSVTESLYKLIAELGKNNIRVIVDFHQPPPPTNRLNGFVVVEGLYSLDDYRKDVAQLATALKGFDNVIGIDVFNEPNQLFWFEPNKNAVEKYGPNNGKIQPQPAWADVIAIAAEEIHKNNPKLMLFVEGIGGEGPDTKICKTGSMQNIPPAENTQVYWLAQNDCGDGIASIHFGANWGENFRSLLDVDAAKLGNPKMGTALRDYLTSTSKLDIEVVNWLLGKPDDATRAGAHIVFSPHVYGKGPAGWQSGSGTSPYRFDWNFGFLHDAGYSVVIGETGYHQPSEDEPFVTGILYDYLKKKGINHNLFFWTFNSNSGDTGGIRKNGDDAQLVVEKEAALHNLFKDDAVTIQLQGPQNSRKKNQ